MPRPALVSLLAALVAGSARAFDPFGAAHEVPSSPSSRVLGEDGDMIYCSPGAPGTPLQLFEAVSRALCHNPKTRQAWTELSLRADAVGSSEAAYLPTLSGSWQNQQEYSSTHVKDRPQLSTSDRSRIFSGSLTLGWLLYDFGKREATVDSARELFKAAQANLDASLQQVFLLTARDYYSALAGRTRLADAQQIERNAKLSLDAAHGRVEKGAASISDELQARTAQAQAALARSRAANDYKAVIGALAIDMGLEPDTALELPDNASDADTGPDFTQSVHTLIEQAKIRSPLVAAAEHELAAAEANEKRSRAQAYPVVSLVSKSTWSDQPTTPQLGVNPVPASDRDSYVGLLVQVPLFDGFGRHYDLRQARAQTEIQRTALFDATQQVAQSVWTSYQSVTAAAEILGNADTMLHSAEQSYEASRQRYQGGAAGILELLSVQNALADARQQRVQALADLRIARLQLAATLGELGLWTIQDTATADDTNTGERK